MILVTGATGHFGKETIDFLLKKGVNPSNISALVRAEAKATDLKEKGIELRIGDYNNYESLNAAFQGVDKLLFVSGTEVSNRTPQHENVVKAAKEAGVKHIIYTSVERQNETETAPLGILGQEHIHTEKIIKESGISYTFLRNNLYLDFIPMILGEKVLETGVFFPAGEGKVGAALRNEMAEAAANVLTTGGHENKEYNTSNSEAVSFKQIAETISNAAGKQVAYVSPDTSTYIDVLVNAGVPKEYAGTFAGFGEAIKQGELAPSKPDMEVLLGRKPTSVLDYIKTIYTSNN